MIKHKVSKKSHPVFTEGESLTEQEHAESCDINIMLRRAKRGQAIRVSSGSLQYGHDDLTIDSVQHRINKQKIEEDLSKLPKDHFTEEELKKVPLNIQQKFGFTPKKQAKNAKDPKNAIKASPGQKPENPPQDPPPAVNPPPEAD